MDPAIETSGLTRRFGHTTAVDGLDLHVRAGELVALVGPDGAGKTTALRLLCGILAPSAGGACVRGIDVASRPDVVRQHVSYAAQSFSLYPDLTVAENLAFFARVYGVPPDVEEKRTRELLDFSKLEQARGRQAGLLSGGMKQKLALACALMHEPDLLLLDEPTTGVDPVSRRELWRILADLHARGKTILLSTPYMDEAERCGRVALLDAGRLVAFDTPEALENALPARILAVRATGLSRGALLSALARVDGAAGPAQPYGSVAHLPAGDPERAAAAARAALAAAGATDVTVEPVAPSLEDVFIARAARRDSSAPSLAAAAGATATSHPTDARTETAIEVRDLTRRFGSFTAVDGVSFSVRRGEIFGFLGPNGSGKTTTIRMICGILQPSGGHAEVLGRDVARQPEAVRQEVGYMSQRFGLYGDLSAAQNLEFYGGMYGVTDRQLRLRRDELIAMAGLQGREKALAAELSGGWRQRLALGCALMHRPPVLLLDEPTGGVDPTSRRDFWDLIYRLAGDGATVLVTTHYMDEAEHCDRIALLHESRLIAVGPPAELKARFPGLLLEVKATPLEVALRALHPWRPALYGTAMHLQLAGEAQIECVRAALQAAGIGDAHLTPIAPSLEDVFLALVAGQRTQDSEQRDSGYQVGR